MESQTKEVLFDIYCKYCKYAKLEETKDPCNECLDEPCNLDSCKPLYFEEED